MASLGRAAVVLLVVGLVAGACGTDEEGGPEAQPAPGPTTFQQGLFDEIPHYPRSEPLGPRQEESEVVAQSFRARDATPEMVLRFYRANLDTWNLVNVPEQLGEATETLRGTWSRDNWILTVAASPAPTVEGDNEAARTEHTQYSLSLAPT